LERVRIILSEHVCWQIDTVVKQLHRIVNETLQ